MIALWAAAMLGAAFLVIAETETRPLDLAAMLVCLERFGAAAGMPL